MVPFIGPTILFHIYHVPGAVLGTGDDATVNQTDSGPCLHEGYILDRPLRQGDGGGGTKRTFYGVPRALRATQNEQAGEEDRAGEWLWHILFIFNNSGPLTL